MVLLLTVVCGVAWTTVRGEEADELDPATLDAKTFLAYARRPFTQEAWGRFEGTIQYNGPEGRAKLPIRMGLMFRPDFMRAQFMLNEQDFYNITQVYYHDAPPHVTLQRPDPEPSPSLATLGLRPGDVTFSFLYWTIVEEREIETVRGRKCRVLLLRHPKDGQQVLAWFSLEFFFPLRIANLEPGKAEPSRSVEFTDFKKHGDLWYVKTIRLTGKDWKTLVKFKDGELKLTEEEAPPPDLFRGGGGGVLDEE